MHLHIDLRKDSEKMNQEEMKRSKENSKRALKSRYNSAIVHYPSPTLIASVVFTLIEFVLASNNATQGTTIVLSDTSIYNQTHNTKPGIEGECHWNSLVYTRNVNIKF